MFKWVLILIMAQFEPQGQFTINSSLVGAFTWAGVHNVRIRKSMRTLLTTCFLEIPGKAQYVPVNGSAPVNVTTRLQFADGDPISISLGYDGVLNNEFTGFVKRRGASYPFVVECEGYERKLRLNVNKSYTSKQPTTAKALLQMACEGTGITVQCDVDFNIGGLRFVNFNGLQICDTIKEVSDHTLTVFFINPTTLWCGLPYSAYAAGGGAQGVTLTNGNKIVNGTSWLGLPSVGYEIGWNCKRDNGLKMRIPSEPVQVLYNCKLATGSLINTASKAKVAQRKLQKLLSHVPDVTTMQGFAQEKEYTMNYTGYEGKISGLLVPYCTPGMNVYVVDQWTPELRGTFIAEDTEVIFGTESGGKRLVGIGPQVGFTNAQA